MRADFCPRLLAYLYALKWQNEYNSISSGFFSCELLYPLPEISWQREQVLRSTHYLSQGTAIEYASEWSGSNKAIEQFEGIARYYKSMFYDCIERFKEYGINKDIQTDEDELYAFLNDFHSYDPIPYEIYRSEYEIPYDTIFPMLIVAVLPDEDIQITSAPPFGAVLTVYGEDYFYPWDSGVPSPKMILPRLSLSDYDGDGIDELAVVLCTGYGTGCYVEELVIVEINDNMAVTTITSETVKESLYHRISAFHDLDTDEIKVIIDDHALCIDINMGDEAMAGGFKGLDLDSIIRFSAGNGVLSVHVTIGLRGFAYATPFGYVELYADVLYHGGTNYRWPDISIANCHLVPDPIH